jgi:lysophospholipase L1-like esterase
MVDMNTRRKCFRVLHLRKIQPLILLLSLFLLQPISYGQQTNNGDLLNCSNVFRIVVLGSSTAYGTGATPIDSSCMNKYRDYVQSKHSQNTIINLATPSLTTYHVLCPTGFVPPPNRPFPVDPDRNITKALSFHPDAIIINLPTNDIALGIPQQESKDNYERTMHLADSANIPVWVTTTQPRNTLSPQERIYLMEFRDWTYLRFGAKAIDFWTDVANPDGTINPLYSAGDGVHVNNNGHSLFYTRTMNERILDSLCLRHMVLPLQLINFNAQKQNNSVTLSWETENEANLSHFVIERSFDSRQWQNLSQVTALNIPGTHNYADADNHPAPGINFYRLKQIDQGGSFTYSRIVKVDFSKSMTLSVSPNPASREVVVQSDKTITAMRLVDMNGKVVKQFTSSATNRYLLTNIPTGFYILKVQAGDFYQSAKLLVQ